MHVKFSRSNKNFSIKTADTFKTRLMGLMGKKRLPKENGLFLEHCGSIHCFFMKFPIDVIYMDENRKVVFIETVKPWKTGTFKYIFSFGKISTLEVNAGEARNIQIGEEMQIQV